MMTSAQNQIHMEDVKGKTMNGNEDTYKVICN